MYALPDDLWELVSAGRDALTPLPDDRGWDLAALRDTAASGGFLSGVGDFDAGVLRDLAA